jgi:hypothetical protein
MAGRAAFFPRIALTASGGITSGDLGNLFKPAGGAWQFIPQVSIPIFDSRARRRTTNKTTAIASIAATLPGSAPLSQDTGGILKSRPDGMGNLHLQKQRKCALSYSGVESHPWFRVVTIRICGICFCMT